MAALHSSTSALHFTTDSNVQKQILLRPASEVSRSFCITVSLRKGFPLRTRNIARHGSRSVRVSAGDAAIMESEIVSEVGVSYKTLQELLEAGEWEKADDETRRLIIVLAGENAVKRKYVFFSEVQFMPKADLTTIDRLWRAYSKGKFGYSVQRKILKRVDGDCTAFFQKVGWMKPLGDDSPQFTYRSFPNEFMWDLSPSTPEGHLPLTNALRGTQLLKALLFHPAFDFADDELQAPSMSSSASMTSSSSQQTQSQPQQKKPLSINYSF